MYIHIETFDAASSLPLEQLQAPASKAALPKPASIQDLAGLLRTINTMMDVAAGMSCMPIMLEGRGNRSAAGLEFDEVCDFLCDKYLDVLARLRDAKARDADEEEDRRVELLKNDLGCCADTTDAALAAVVRAMPHKF